MIRSLFFAILSTLIGTAEERPSVILVMTNDQGQGDLVTRLYD